jgi:CheY-specific phosphatase CheX
MEDVGGSVDLHRFPLHSVFVFFGSQGSWVGSFTDCFNESTALFVTSSMNVVIEDVGII